jgi:hypothetical protein
MEREQNRSRYLRRGRIMGGRILPMSGGGRAQRHAGTGTPQRVGKGLGALACFLDLGPRLCCGRRSESARSTFFLRIALGVPIIALGGQ